MLGDPSPPATATSDVAPPEDAGVAADATAPAVRAVNLAVVIHDAPQAGDSEVSLAVTDETGATRNVAVGTFPGHCIETPAVADAALGQRDPVIAVDCAGGERGARIRLVREDDALIVLRAWVTDGSAGAYNIIDRIALPAGAAVN